MKKLNIKTKSFALIIIALMIASVTFIAMPIQPVKAQIADQQINIPSGVTPTLTMTTRAFLGFRPTPVGLGQPLLINTWISPPVNSQRKFFSSITGCFIVTITKPDRTTDVIRMPDTYSDAATWIEITADQVGEWKIKFDFLGTYFPAGRYLNGYIMTNSSGDYLDSSYYTPSSTTEQNLTVQQDMVWSWPASPLPTDYWTRPAQLTNREWWSILGSYPDTGYVGGGPIWDELYPDTNPHDGLKGNDVKGYNFVPWVQAPNSGHIVWKQQNAISGLIGGPAGQYGITSNPGNPSLVYSGRCYQTMTVPINGIPTSCAVCYDLRTGQQYYTIPIASGGVTPTQIAYLDPATTTGAAGAWSVELIAISGGYLMKVNPFTGALTGNYSIAPLTGSGGVYYMNRYVLGVQTINATAGIYRLINWTTTGSSTTLASRIISNITWPWRLDPGSYTSANGREEWTADFNVGIAVYLNGNAPSTTLVTTSSNLTAASLTTGQILWNVNVLDEPLYSPSCFIADHGKAVYLSEKGHYMAFDLFTGKLAWKSEDMDYPYGLGSFGAYAEGSAYGLLLRQSYDGVYAFNWTNGKIVWRYIAVADAPYESPFVTDGITTYPFNSAGTIADGKLYVANSEHTPSWPVTRGYSLFCLNMTTGELIWKIGAPMAQGAVVDGYLTAANSYDGYMYVFGKGKSTTTVTAPDVVVPKGSGIVIRGTVLDSSPAQPGTPCVSKDSMETQMEYLHLQQQIGGLWGNLTITGVPVTLQAIDSNNNIIAIGTATTNGYYGTLTYTWTPPHEGDYQIVASFAGDDSYGSSSASTSISVGEAPTATITPTTTTAPSTLTNTDDLVTYMIIVGIAIIIAIAIVGAILYRKH